MSDSSSLNTIKEESYESPEEEIDSKNYRLLAEW